MRNLSINEANSGKGKELNDFGTLALPFQNSHYRTALILTRSPRNAKELVQQTYSYAQQKYRQLEPGADFGAWLFHLLLNYHISKQTGKVKRDNFARG